MRAYEAGVQLDFETFMTPETRAAERPAPTTHDMHVYGEDFALVRVRDGFYADERRVFYVARGRVYLLRSPRLRPGQGFRRIAALPASAQSVDETSFDPDDAGDQALFAVADCIDGIS
ncbi:MULTISPECIES: hypothetical protein [Nannocystis]|jgi:hypothetical protein|uniref:Uncharacterized protein n=1 Tax=Nannocystis radixulma TaxID=2995305 RepID=A0ABT5BD60_9BACT|nr:MULTISPECIES: hypothetical protein [Nannocystis]MDC0671459.1 hypothetical protein [Nannocystis radixulma]